MILAQSLPLQLLNHMKFFDAHIYCTYLKRIEGVEEIQFEARKKRKIPTRRAAWKRKYMSFRSTARALRNTNICRWHIASIAVALENGAKHGFSCSLPSSTFVPSPPFLDTEARFSFRSLYLSPPPRELPFHWQPLLRKSSPFGFKWGLVHTMLRVIYPLGTRGSSTRQTKEDGTERFIHWHSAFYRYLYRFLTISSNFTFLKSRNDQTTVVLSERFVSN